MLYKDTAGEWRFRFVSGNGKIVAASQGLATTKRVLPEGGRNAVRKDCHQSPYLPYLDPESGKEIEGKDHASIQ